MHMSNGHHDFNKRGRFKYIYIFTFFKSLDKNSVKHINILKKSQSQHHHMKITEV